LLPSVYAVLILATSKHHNLQSIVWEKTKTRPAQPMQYNFEICTSEV
jgi:hypothetical protein